MASAFALETPRRPIQWGSADIFKRRQLSERLTTQIDQAQTILPEQARSTSVGFVVLLGMSGEFSGACHGRWEEKFSRIFYMFPSGNISVINSGYAAKVRLQSYGIIRIPRDELQVGSVVWH
ncbi:hypothetical protein [Ralstonia insidiosa]|jgi:hypothetical protein|nr:hypothetical protein [Ralstonia insidiosa]MBC9968011.1 hypothetical protein [Ralstonia insidiosa]MBX3904426.1 hypothetical protein [Ralstonia insidiosa]